MNRGPGLSGDRRIIWRHVLTVISAAILIGAEVFGAAFAGGWAVANLFDLTAWAIPARIVALAFGVLLAIVAVVYWVIPAGSLPEFLPGFESGITRARVRYGNHAALASVFLFVLSWFAGDYLLTGVEGVQFLFFLCGIAVMIGFIRSAQRIEPFTTRG